MTENYYLGLLLKYQYQEHIKIPPSVFSFEAVQFPNIKRRFAKLLGDDIIGIKSIKN